MNDQLVPDAGFFSQKPSEQPSAPVPNADFFTPQAQAPSPAQPSWLQQVGAGAVQGLHDVTDYPAQKLAGGIGALAHTVGLAPDWHPGADTTAGDVAQGKSFEQNYGSSIPANVSRFGTDAGLTAAEIAGGSGLIAGGARALAPAVGPEAATLGARAGQFLSGNSPLTAAKWLSYPVRGALEGAAATAGSSGSQGPDLSDTVKGAGLGAVAAPVAGVAGKVLGMVAPVAQHALGWVADTPALTMSAAKNKVAEALARDGIAPADAVAAMRQLGPGATLADVGGRNVQTLGQVIANTPGEGATAAQTALEGRMGQAVPELQSAINQFAGGSRFQGTIDDLAEQRAAAARPLYEQAFQTANIGTKEARQFQPFVTSPEGQDALQVGMRDMRREALARGEPFDPSAFGVTTSPDSGKFIIMPNEVRGPDGRIQQAEPVPGLRLLDAVKRGFDAIVADNRDPMTGRLNSNGRSADLVRSALVSKLRSTFPDYANALDAWAGPSRAMDALKAGKQAITPSTEAETVAKQIGNLPDADKPFYRMGIGSALMQKLLGTPDGSDAVRRLFKTPGIRENIAAAADSPESLDQFASAMTKWTKFADTKNTTLRGSQSFQRFAGAVDVAKVLPHAVSALMGDYSGAMRGMAMEGLKNAATTPSEHVNSAIGNLLFNSDPDLLQQQFVGWRPGLLQRGAGAAKAGVSRSVVPLATTATVNQGRAP